jgi:hypothetical protein
MKTDRRRSELRPLWRLSAWGGAAALALAALAVTAQTEVGGERLKLALAQPGANKYAVALLPQPQRQPEKGSDTSALEAQVRSLTADRDRLERLASRLAGLERHLDDITGSIGRQPAQPARTAVPAADPAPHPVGSIPAGAPTRSAATLPVIRALGTTAELARPATAIIDPLAMPPGSEGTGSWPEAAVSDAAAPPLAEAMNVVPLPPVRLAALPPKTRRLPPPPAVSRYEYGIELGIAPDLEALRARWTAVKANHGPLLGGLQPLALRDPRPGGKHLRLVAGPMPSLSAARLACAKLSAAHAACRPARFTADAVVQP